MAGERILHLTNPQLTPTMKADVEKLAGDWTYNQRILFVFDLEALPMIEPGGTLTTSEPSPMTREEIVPVLEALARQPEYKQHTITCHDLRMTPVTLAAGKVQA